MSSFQITAKHKETGETHRVWCLDDYFGKRVYGYVYGEKAMREDEFYKLYEVENE